jgi:anthranilate phosphoribosyltransferase
LSFLTCAQARCAGSGGSADYGLASCAPTDLAGGDAAHNAQVLQRTLAGEERGAPRDALLLGAALALEVSGVEAAPRLAIARAAQAIDSGAAAALLEKLVRFHATASA